MDNSLSGYERADKSEDTTYNPLVSIITPVLNGVKYLEPCIESVLSQSYPHIEHVLVDGGSTDGTMDVLSRYSTKYPDRVRFISEPDEGGDDAANKGVQMAKGEIIGLLGSDDMMETGAIQKVIEFFRTNPSAYFVYGDCNFIDDKGEVFRRYRPGDFDLDKILNDTMYIAMTSAFYKREVFEKVGLYYVTPEAAWVSDIDFLIRACRVFQIHWIDEVFSSFRVRKMTFSGSNFERTRMMMKGCYMISRRHGGSIFSGYFRGYYACQIIDWLRPVLGFIYPFVEKVVNKSRFKKR